MAKSTAAEDTLDRARDVTEDEARARAERARKGGGKLSRSETVTVRLDPRLNYLCELAARAQRRTKSSFIEWAIDEALKQVTIPGVAGESIAMNAQILWDVEEADRLASLALNAPVLMTHEEQVIWKLVEGNGLLWKGSYNSGGKWAWDYTEARHFRWDVFREHYATFKGVAEGELPKSELPKWEENDPRWKKPSAFDADLDEDVPF